MSDTGLRDLIAGMVHEALTAEVHAIAVPQTVSTVAEYVAGWLEARRQIHLVSVEGDEARMRLHVLPVLGKLPMASVRPHHIRALFVALRAAAELAPRSVRHVYAVTSTMFRCAVAEEVIASSPCILQRGVLPANVDRDPEWRARAIFTRQELQVLLTDQRVPEQRRMLYGLKGMTGMRHTEAATLRWDQIDKAEPLARICLGKTKSKKPRQIPVHPTLSWMLDRWLRCGWARTYGRSPRPTDLVVPSRRGTPLDSPGAQKRLLTDLGACGLRRRRGHDFKRTFVTLCREDGANDAILKAITHGPTQEILSQYTSWSWPALCAEVLKLRVTLSAVSAQLDLDFPSPSSHRTTSEPMSGFEPEACGLRKVREF